MTSRGQCAHFGAHASLETACGVFCQSTLFGSFIGSGSKFVVGEFRGGDVTGRDGSQGGLAGRLDTRLERTVLSGPGFGLVDALEG